MAARSEHARIEAAHRSRIDDSNGLSSTSWGGEGSWRAFTKIHGGQKLRSLCSPLFPPLVLFSIQLFHSFPTVLFIRIGPLLLSPPLIGRLALFLSLFYKQQSLLSTNQSIPRVLPRNETSRNRCSSLCEFETFLVFAIFVKYFES